MTKSDIKTALAESDRPVMSVAHLTDALPASHVTIRNYCLALAEAGELETVKIGKATAFYLPESHTESEPTDPEKAKA
ncbi:hypothetical protein M0R89_10450 [Halorussus limi]|uniref:Uncharacterized protein n=1 Tax=Halorussus limi TaxID=2938695 RepID=A0A8U0HQ03_9EURY|nr:hypothetical protein [Halorussus limi]UPV72968.1 hypothetical protein M0R89_10450 [Halorussus limi]